MVVNENVIDEKSVRNKKRNQNQSYVYIMGKKLTPKQVNKKIKHKPRLISTILINSFIILAIIITILLVTGM
ncbi:MAG: hypothetical protein ACFFDN_39790 [Candidatus Hodarchaeota archaeon]